MLELISKRTHYLPLASLKLSLTENVNDIDEREGINTLTKFTYKDARLEDSIIPNTCSNLG